jgi:hypothetical protein
MCQKQVITTFFPQKSAGIAELFRAFFEEKKLQVRRLSRIITSKYQTLWVYYEIFY